MRIVLCPYCKAPAELVTGVEIYPHRSDLFKKNFWNCNPCNAYVGCHDGTVNPLGRLANEKLRRMKRWAHDVFDPLWKEKGVKRGEAYLRLARSLGIPMEECHIGMFSEQMCMRVVEIARETNGTFIK